MALQFIFGNPGSGKSHYLYHEIIGRSMEHPEKNYIVLVPEQFTMQTQKDLVMMHPRRGIMNIDVLSFVRLAHHVFEETGGMKRTVLDDTGKSLILRKLSENEKQKLPVLGGNLKKPGYISEIKSLISEFTQYDITEEEIERMLSAVEKDSYLYFKIKDIGKIYREFSNYLAGKYITGEELLDALCPAVKHSEKLKGSTLVLDGFTGFTPVQNKLLRECLKVCEDIIVTVTMDERENPYVYQHPYQLFALSKQMVSSLMEIAKEERAEILEPVCMYGKPVYRFRENEALGFLEQHLFRYTKEVYEKTQDALTLHCAGNPRQEVTYVAAKIRRLVREKGYHYRDIAVIASDTESYLNQVEQVFGIYGIPVFMDHKRSILLNSFVEYIRSLLAMIEQNLTYESVFRYLRTGLSGFLDEEVDCLENYVIALGVKGYKKWQSPWIRRAKGMKEEELAALNELRVRLMKKTETLTNILKKRKKTVHEITLALYEFLVRENMQEEMQKYERRFTEAGELVLAKEYSQIYRLVIELLEKFDELLGDEPISLKEYRELLDTGFEEAKVGVIPPGLDQVVVGDIERTRIKDVKALFLIGVNDTFIPGNKVQGGLLSEMEREKFAKEKIVLAPSAKEKIYTQKFYLYQNMTKPTEYLSLSYSRTTSDGKGTRPAYLIQDIRRLYPLVSVTDEEKRPFSETELTKKQGLMYLIEGFQKKGEPLLKEWKELYNYYRSQPEWEEELGWILDAVFYRKPLGKLSEWTAKELYQDMERAGVTRLERFSSCAFSHFLTYGLRLQEREEYQFAALDLGNIFHQVMERFSKELTRRGVLWTEIKEEEREALIEECIESSITDYGNTVLYSSARDEYMIARIRRMVKRSVWALTEQLKRGDFVPEAYEVSFGHGRIDRIDTCEDEDRVYVKVIDYKTGTKAFDIVALYHGLQMQLVFYMNAALAFAKKKHPGKEAVPAGVFYYKMKDPLVEAKEGEEVSETILKELRLDGLVNEDKEVVERLDRAFDSSSSVIPVSKTKSGGFSAYSKTVSREEFQVISDYVSGSTKKIENRILGGDISVNPYEMGQSKGCDYCPYRGVCRFDEKIPGYEYRKLGKLKKEEVIERMREEL